MRMVFMLLLSCPSLKFSFFKAGTRVAIRRNHWSRFDKFA